MFFPENLDELFDELCLSLLKEQGKCYKILFDESVAMFDKILPYRCNTSANKKTFITFLF